MAARLAPEISLFATRSPSSAMGRQVEEEGAYGLACLCSLSRDLWFWYKVRALEIRPKGQGSSQQGNWNDALLASLCGYSTALAFDPDTPLPLWKA